MERPYEQAAASGSSERQACASRLACAASSPRVFESGACSLRCASSSTAAVSAATEENAAADTGGAGRRVTHAASASVNSPHQNCLVTALPCGKGSTSAHNRANRE